MNLSFIRHTTVVLLFVLVSHTQVGAQETTQWTFPYTGSIQTFTAPCSGIYQLQVWGAQGGDRTHQNNAFAAGGKGGYATCRTSLTAGETVYVYVGGQGGTVVDDNNRPAGAGGWNGGGAGGNGVSNHSGSAGGGGATHISKVNNQIIGNGCNFLGGTDYIIVAGGGGGAGHNVTTAGAGGGTEGERGTYYTSSGQRAYYSDHWYYGTADSRGARGGHGLVNGSTACEGAGGGGAGYLGGNANVAYGTFTTTYQDAGGSGGNSACNSSFATHFSTTAGQRSGNGQATITILLKGSGTSADPYQIPSTAAWDFLADNVNNGNNYSEKFFRLTNDISITTMVGTNNGGKPFSGTFDGNGLTLNVSLEGSGECTAAFGALNEATIKNLHITGSVETTAVRPASIAGFISGNSTIENCWSEVAISSGQKAFWVDAGAFVARVNSGKILTLNGCLFTGSITYSESDAYEGGGMVGWAQENAAVNFYDCVFAPSAIDITEYQDQYTFAATYDKLNVSKTIQNCYFNDVVGALVKTDTEAGFIPEGKHWHSITADTDVTLSNLGAATATYNVSGITAYAHGIKYNDVFYAGDGESVALSLSHSSKTGYTFSQYGVTGGGSLANPTTDTPTLTMTDANQIISAEWTENESLAIPVTLGTVLGESKYVTTFYHGTLDYQLPAGALAYTAGKDGNKVVFYRIGPNSNVIPHDTAVIIVADASAISEGTVTLTKISSAGVPPGINILMGSDTAVTELTGKEYVLGIAGDVIGFYPFTGSAIPAGKAYYNGN